MEEGSGPAPQDEGASLVWTRDYFDDAPAQRLRHRVTRLELDELCYFVGLLERGGKWPPALREADDPDGPFGLATVAAEAGPVYVQHISGRPSGAGTRDIAVFFGVLAERQRVRIVGVVDAKRLRRARERSVIVGAAALRALLAAEPG